MNLLILIVKTCVITFLILIISSCKKVKSETKISSNNSSESHNMGQNCMNCHVSGGKGEGWFQIAGTVYDTTFTKTSPNTTIKLYTAPNGGGTLKHTIQVDALGNFYSTENLDFGAGLYPTVLGKTLSKHMTSKVLTGQCNSCHGVTIDKIWVD